MSVKSERTSKESLGKVSFVFELNYSFIKYLKYFNVKMWNPILVKTFFYFPSFPHAPFSFNEVVVTWVIFDDSRN